MKHYTFGAALLVLAACTTPVWEAGAAPTPHPADGLAHYARWPAARLAAAERLYASIWLEADREPLRAGDRVRIRFQSSTDAHVAVIHLDTEGNLDLLFPEAPWADDRVRAGRTNSLPATGWDARWTVAEPAGIGYFYLIASREPLDYRALRHSSGSRWDWSRVGSTVRGDPFYALEGITDLLTGGIGGDFATDLQSYFVGERVRYPAYACSDRYGSHAWDADRRYGSCDRLIILLRERPYYYDTRRDRGTRRGYYGGIGAEEVHGYKAPARAPLPSYRPRPGEAPPASRAEEPRRSAPSRTVRPAPSRPEPAERPRLERRPPERAEPRAPEKARPQEPKPERSRREPRSARPEPPPAADTRPSAAPADVRPSGG